MQWKEKKRREKRREEQNKKQTTHSTIYQRREHQRQPESNEMRNAYACTFGLLDFVLNSKQKRSPLNAHSSTLAAWIQFDIVDFSIVSHWNYNSEWYKNPSVHLAEENEEIKMEKRWADGIGIGEKRPHAELTKLSNKKKISKWKEKEHTAKNNKRKKSTFGAGKMELKRLLHRATFITISAIKI